MRVVVFFDLPTETAEERRDYRRFRAALLKNGFFMMQESVYSKIILNNTAANVIKETVRKLKTGKGLIQMLTVTERQFENMEFVLGKKTIDGCRHRRKVGGSVILSHFDLEKPLELTPAVVNVLVVENENKFFDFCKEFALQSKGNSGNFVLFDGDTKLSLVKDVKLLYDFFNFDLGDKRARDGLLNCLVQIAENNFAVEYSELVEKIYAFFEKLNGETDFPIDFDTESSLTQLLKAYGVRWKDEKDCLLESIVSFIHFNARILGIKCFAFFNLKNFLNEKDLKSLYYEAQLEDVCLFLLENTLKNKTDEEFVTLIDKDLCEIIV